MDEEFVSIDHVVLNENLRPMFTHIAPTTTRKRSLNNEENAAESEETFERRPIKQTIPSLASLLAEDSFLSPHGQLGYNHVQQGYNRLPIFGEAKIPFMLPSIHSYHYNPLNPPVKSTNAGFTMPPMYSPQFSPELSTLRDPKYLDPRDLPSQNQHPYRNYGLPKEEPHHEHEEKLKKSIDREIKERCRVVDLSKSSIPMEVSPFSTGLTTTDNLTTSNRFILVQQPNEIQRKSYKKENRCLLPNPLIICLKDPGDRKLPQILDGVVTLKLVNNDGSELPPHKQNALEGIEGGLTHPFGEDHTACFSVKVLQTSEGNHFRLVFNISYRLKGTGHVEETIVSRPFAVYSNKHNRNARKKPKRD